MFSSLEALDAEDNLNATPVMRHGAFQPKAKPRVRKGVAMPPRTAAPAPKIKKLPPPASDQIDEPERNQFNVAKLQEEVERAREVARTFESSPQNLLSQSSLVERNFDNQTVAVTPDVFNKVGIERGSTYNTGLTDASPLRTADFTDSERNLNSDFNAAIECQAITAFHEPTTSVQVAGIFESPVNAVAATQESVALSSELSLEKGAIGFLGTLSQEDDLGSLTVVPIAPSAFDELLASHAFKSVQSVGEKYEPHRKNHAPMEKEGFLSKLIYDSCQDHCEREVDECTILDIESLVSESVAPLKEIEHTTTSACATQVPDEPAVEHVADAGVSSQQVVSGKDDLLSLPATETTGALRKKKRPRKDRQDDSLVLNQGSQVLAKEAPVVENGTITKSEATPAKKRKGSDVNEQRDKVSIDANLNSQKERKRAKAATFTASSAVEATSANEEAPMKSAVEAEKKKKKKKKGSKQVQERRDDVEKTTSKPSSKKTKKAMLNGSTSVNAAQSAAEVAVEVSGAKETARKAGKTAATKQEAQSQVEEQQENGEAHTSSATSKRKRQKPARFLDGADDDEINATNTSITGSSEPAKKRKRGESQGDKQQDVADDDLLTELFPSLPKKISKLKESKLTSTSRSPIEAGHKANGLCKPVIPAAEESQKKKFKKCVQQRRRVERRAMNPANPDLDPKKMTMKDIIRLAEAKERMLKKDNAKKTKNANQVTVNEPEREPESYESACLAPQVQIIDGQIVINEHSLVINAHPKDDIRTYKRVEETHAKLNYHSYMKRTPSQTWRPDETELFYQALREFGTNFAMIQHLFPGRTRKQVLLKFKKEERCSPLRISEAMRVKPCETSHFLEVISSLNLLPSEIPDELEVESGTASIPVELSSSKKEVEDSNQVERGMADGDGLAIKLDECSVQSMNPENHDKSSSSPCITEALTSGQPNGNQELHTTEDPFKLNEIDQRCESPKIASTLPRKKKSLFSYQTSTAKS